MSSAQLSHREFWSVSAAMTAVLTILLLAAGLAGAALGVRYGVVPGPSLTIKLGTVQIIAATNNYPNCNPLAAACVAQAQAGGAASRYYSVWVVTAQKVPGPGSAPEQYGGAPVFAIQAGP